MTPMEVLYAVIKCLDTKDLEGMLGYLSDDCTISKDRNELMISGKEQLREFYAGIIENHSKMKIELVEYLSVGSVLVVHEINRGMKVSGVARDIDTVWVYQIYDDKVQMMHVFSPTQKIAKVLKFS